MANGPITNTQNKQQRNPLLKRAPRKLEAGGLVNWKKDPDGAKAYILTLEKVVMRLFRRTWLASESKGFRSFDDAITTFTMKIYRRALKELNTLQNQ